MTDRTARMLRFVENALPVGRAVRYYPIDGEQDHVVTAVRSAPWVLGHGCIVIKVTGISGCVAVDHLEVI